MLRYPYRPKRVASAGWITPRNDPDLIGQVAQLADDATGMKDVPLEDLTSLQSDNGSGYAYNAITWAW